MAMDPAQTELTKNLLAMSNRYEQVWAPQFERFRTEVLDSGPESRRASAGSTASTARAFSEVAPQVATATTRRGGNAAMALGNLAADQGMSGGLSLVDTNQAVSDKRLQDIGGLVQLNQGNGTNALRGLADVADMYTSQARSDAQIAAQNSQGLQDALFTGGGLAASGYMTNQKKDPRSYAIGGIYGPALDPGVPGQ
jgi:hypothetical protein